MTLPGPVPSHPQTPIERIAQLERTIRTMQSAPKFGGDSDLAMYKDCLSTSPRNGIQNVGASMSLNIPRGVLLYTPTPTPSVKRLSFIQQNSSVSSATIDVAIYTGLDPSALTYWGSGQNSITASLADIYIVELNNTGPLPAGLVLLVAQAVSVGASVPALSVSGQSPINTFVYTGDAYWTCVVGTNPMSPWPSQTSLSGVNTGVWIGSQSPVWLAAGS